MLPVVTDPTRSPDGQPPVLLVNPRRARQAIMVSAFVL
jgi:hypothetical protein